MAYSGGFANKPPPRGSDFLARFGGDEFVVITSGRASDQVPYLAARLIGYIGNGRPMDRLSTGALGLSIGIAELDFDNPDADKLLFNADQAMYEGKRAGKRCYRVAAIHKRQEATHICYR